MGAAGGVPAGSGIWASARLAGLVARAGGGEAPVPGGGLHGGQVSGGGEQRGGAGVGDLRGAFGGQVLGHDRERGEAMFMPRHSRSSRSSSMRGLPRTGAVACAGARV